MKLLLIYICIFLLTMTPVALFAEGEHDNVNQSEQTADTKHNDGDEDHGEVVQLTPSELDEFEIELSTASSGIFRKEIVVPGEVAVNYDKLAHIAPRFPGVVKKVNKHLGEKVKTGDVLAVIESNEGLVPYEIKSLSDGVVIEKHITIGEVSTEDVSAFVITDLDTVWVNFSIYQMHLPYVKVGQKMIISSGKEYKEATGVISYLSPIVDEHTRTATARVVIPNLNRDWRPGLFVEGRIVIDEELVSLLVPKSSLQKFEGNDVIFVSTPKGFKPVKVKIGRVNKNSAEILSGLVVGQKYASKGAFTIKAELKKSSLSDSH